jgi:SOS-response transcriptional repressor LexA
MTRQSQILEVIESYIIRHGCSPSNREIAAAAGLKSASSVLRHLQQLKADGYVSFQPGVPRTVRVLPRPAPDGVEQVLDTRDPDQVVWVPFVGLRPAAIATGERLFLMRIADNWRSEAWIRPGDWVVVRQPGEQLRDGNLVGVLHPV